MLLPYLRKLALCDRLNKVIQVRWPYSWQEAQLSPSDRAMRLVSSNLANYHATVQKLLIRQVLADQSDGIKLEV